MLPCGLTTAVPETADEELSANVEVVKPDISPPNTERRMSPTKSRTTSAAPLSMLYSAGRAWGTMLSHGMTLDDTAVDETLDEMLDEIVDECKSVLLTGFLDALELCWVFDARGPFWVLGWSLSSSSSSSSLSSSWAISATLAMTPSISVNAGPGLFVSMPSKPTLIKPKPLAMHPANFSRPARPPPVHTAS